MDNNLKSLNILVIEDDRRMQKLIHDVLMKLGFSAIYKAANGNTALTLMNERAFDFVICDWRMEGMDGIEFTKAVRGSAKTYALVPIIMLTGNSEVYHVCEARDAGVNEYLIKPFTVKDLCSRLKEIIDRPREFVLSPIYKGPSRRRRSLLIAGSERRRTKINPVPRQVTNGNTRRSS